MSLVEVETSGDRDMTSSVATLTEVGAFVRAIQETVLEGRADLAVHSCKDLPVEGPTGLEAVYPERDEPGDVLCGHDLSSLLTGARVGTGSPRRAAQMRRLRPDAQVVEIRGNVDTRLEKLHDRQYDAVVLAEAGLRRLGLEHEIGYRFGIEEMVPAPAQGALAVEAIRESPAALALQKIDHAGTRLEVEAERELLSLTQAGCRSALGALACVEPDGVAMTGFVADHLGARTGRAHGSTSHEAARNLQKALRL